MLFSLPQTYAARPLWSDSTTQTVGFEPMPKKAAVLRLPELRQRPPGPVLCGDRPQGERVRARGCMALKRLREVGNLNWVRRCAKSWQDGRFMLEQETNAYAVLPATQWRGYRKPAGEAPARPRPARGRLSSAHA
jgi:hypothetical protein